MPNIRYGESVESTINQIRALEQKITDGLDRSELNRVMPAGAARNAIDCALWDLEAKISEKDVAALNGLSWPTEVDTVQTISILSPKKMHDAARALAKFPIIKVKANADQVLERLKAVHSGAPQSKLLIDANESWTIELLSQLMTDLIDLNVKMIEQPLHADDDHALTSFQSVLPIFADESCHTTSDLKSLGSKYQGINIKLDKTGGLTEALALQKSALHSGYDTMVGCMLSTSLGIAPAMLLTRGARFVDIDAPALLAKDRQHAIQVKHGKASSFDSRLWGGIRN